LRHLSLLLISLPLLAQEPRTATSPGGVKVEWLAEGKPGTAPAAGDVVKVHYTGTLTDGKKFDSSLDRGEPIRFVLGVGMVIKGWDEGIALLDEGAKAKLTIPWSLAYGEQGRGKVIPPKADLVFEVELVSVTKGPAFRASDPAKQKATESGLKWEAIEEGSGEPPGTDDLVNLRCTIWTTEGKIAFSSAALPTRLVTRAGGAQLTPLAEKFMPEAVRMMKPGGSCRFEVPAAIGWGKTRVVPNVGEDETTIWQIDLVRILRLTPLDPDKTKRTASGLEYEVLAEGSGASPGPGATVLVHYIGWLEDGKEFDCSYRRGKPAQFALGGVIRGWTEGLQLMKPGATYRFRIPPALAYGEKGMGATIPGNATLVFEVDLLRSS
jgi:FKBP-type peptidyl-prolyl cis-trans isomerase